MKQILGALLLLLTIIALPACRRLDDKRLPVAPVRLTFTTVAEWNAWGVPGAMAHRRYIKEERQPTGYPYTALSMTGYGGILLVGDILGAPRAYDLACPVECKSNIRITVDTDTYIARCPRCHSTYDIFNNYGQPLSGPALEDGYGLQKYYVGAGPQGEYMIVSR